MERNGQDAACPLQLKVHRRRLAITGEEREGRVGAGRQVHEGFCQLERFLAFVAVEANNKIGLYEGDVLQNKVDVLRYLADLVKAAVTSRF